MNPNANTPCESCNAPHAALCVCDVPLEELLDADDPRAADLEAEYMADCAAGDTEYDPAEDVDPTDLLHATTCLCEACVPPDIDDAEMPGRPGREADSLNAIAVLPKGSYVPSFADRCRAARVTIYAEQRRRNERFEHLRRLLIGEPSPARRSVLPAAPPMATLRGQVHARLHAESRSTARCTCCHEHVSPVFKHDDHTHEPVHTYLRNGWALRECEACIRNFLADRKAAEVGERVKGQCRAEIHCWATESPDSWTVKPERERIVTVRIDDGDPEPDEAIVDLLDGDPVSANDIDQVDADKPRLRAVEALQSSTRTLNEDMADEPIFDQRPTGAITTNLKTGWVTYTSSQAKARVTVNVTTSRIKVRYGRLDIYDEHLRGVSTEQLFARRDGLAAWCERWLAKRGIEPNVATARTHRAKDAVRETRELRDALARTEIRANVKFIR